MSRSELRPSTSSSGEQQCWNTSQRRDHTTTCGRIYDSATFNAGLCAFEVGTREDPTPGYLAESDPRCMNQDLSKPWIRRGELVRKDGSGSWLREVKESQI